MTRASAVAAVAAALLLVGEAAALEPALTPRERFELAQLVVHAEVTTVETRLTTGDGAGVEREVWLAPIATLRGTAPDALSVVLPGGAIDGLRVAVEDTPTLEPDRQYLLFLRQGPSGWVVLGQDGAIRLGTPGVGDGPGLAEVAAALELPAVTR